MEATGFLFTYEGKRGNVFYAQLRLPDATQKKIRLGKEWPGRGRPDEGFLTRSQAEVRVDELIADANDGVLFRQSNILFATAASEWLTYLEVDRKRENSTLYNYRRVVAEILPRWSGLKAEEVTPDLIEDWREEMVESDLSPATVNKRLRVVSGIFKLAIKRHGVSRNPIDSVEFHPAAKSSGNIGVYSPEEVSEVSAAARSWYGLLFTFAAYSGLRMGELRALTWRDIDFEGRLIHVRRNFVLGLDKAPKSNQVRSVPLTDQALDALLARRDESQFTSQDDLVWANDVGNPFDPARMRQHFKAAIKAADLRPIRFHDLRHTFGTLAVNVWELPRVQAYMGHAEISTTMIYVHHKTQEGDAAALSDYVAQRLAA